jgi:hypothetical protein
MCRDFFSKNKNHKIMGALLVFGLVIVIANVGGIYFYIQEHKKD